MPMRFEKYSLQMTEVNVALSRIVLTGAARRIFANPGTKQAKRAGFFFKSLTRWGRYLAP